jgi:hypothetical protein
MLKPHAETGILQLHVKNAFLELEAKTGFCIWDGPYCGSADDARNRALQGWEGHRQRQGQALLKRRHREIGGLYRHHVQEIHFIDDELRI